MKKKKIQNWEQFNEGLLDWLGDPIDPETLNSEKSLNDNEKTLIVGNVYTWKNQYYIFLGRKARAGYTADSIFLYIERGGGEEGEDIIFIESEIDDCWFMKHFYSQSNNLTIEEFLKNHTDLIEIVIKELKNPYYNKYSKDNKVEQQLQDNMLKRLMKKSFIKYPFIKNLYKKSLKVKLTAGNVYQDRKNEYLFMGITDDGKYTTIVMNDSTFPIYYIDEDDLNINVYISEKIEDHLLNDKYGNIVNNIRSFISKLEAIISDKSNTKQVITMFEKLLKKLMENDQIKKRNNPKYSNLVDIDFSKARRG